MPYRNNKTLAQGSVILYLFVTRFGATFAENIDITKDIQKGIQAYFIETLQKIHKMLGKIIQF